MARPKGVARHQTISSSRGVVPEEDHGDTFIRIGCDCIGGQAAFQRQDRLLKLDRWTTDKYVVNVDFRW